MHVERGEPTLALPTPASYSRWRGRECCAGRGCARPHHRRTNPGRRVDTPSGSRKFQLVTWLILHRTVFLTSRRQCPSNIKELSRLTNAKRHISPQTSRFRENDRSDWDNSKIVRVELRFCLRFCFGDKVDETKSF